MEMQKIHKNTFFLLLLEIIFEIEPIGSNVFVFTIRRKQLECIRSKRSLFKQYMALFALY